MIINRLNYELFLVDYLDGKLDPLLVDELLVFLEKNPDIKEEYDGIQNSFLEKEIISFPNKSILKKKSFSKNGIDDELDYLCISSIERTLNEEEQNLLRKKVFKDETLKKKLELYEKTLCHADQSIIYKSKNSLKRTSIVPIRQSTFKIGVAATIALLIGSFALGRVIFQNNSINSIQENSLAIYSEQAIIKTTPNVENKFFTEKEIKQVSDNEFLETKNNNKIDVVKQSQSFKKEELIPEKLNRIEPSEITTSRSYPETLALNTYPKQTYPLLLNKHLLASNENIENRGSVKEIGVFEIIQYGVKSVGNFFGSNLQLTAKKDKNGKIKEIRFDSKLIAFTAPVGKNE